MMKKIEEFVLGNYKLMIPIGFIAVVFIAFFVYIGARISSQYHEDSNENVYQYFYDRKYEYKALISKNRKGAIIDFKPVSEKINLDSTPIYLKKSGDVIFSSDMSVVMPTLSCSEYLVPKYSYISFKDGIYSLTANRYYHKKLNHYFFFDGGDLYFFIEKVTLSVNNEKIELSPYSYVIAKYNNYLSYYDKKSDTFKTLTIDNHNVIVENEYYTILIDKDIIDYQGNNVVLVSDISSLNTVDKKDR